MNRLNLLLLATLIACAVALVTSQHQARKLFVEWEKEQDIAKQLDIEWNQLQLEQSTWAMHTRIERIATTSLKMRAPAAEQTRIVTLERSPLRSAAAGTP